jgi:hypothetical protein
MVYIGSTTLILYLGFVFVHLRQGEDEDRPQGSPATRQTRCVTQALRDAKKLDKNVSETKLLLGVTE